MTLDASAAAAVAPVNIEISPSEPIRAIDFNGHVPTGPAGAPTTDPDDMEIRRQQYEAAMVIGTMAVKGYPRLRWTIDPGPMNTRDFPRLEGQADDYDTVAAVAKRWGTMVYPLYGDRSYAATHIILRGVHVRVWAKIGAART